MPVPANFHIYALRRSTTTLHRVKLSEADISEFITLCEADGVKLTPDEARPIAMRLILLYRHLARPTPMELVVGLAKRQIRVTVEGDPPQPAVPPTAASP